MRARELTAGALACLLAVGCGSDPETLEETDLEAEGAAGALAVPLEDETGGDEDDAPDPLSMTAVELERELGLTEAGKVILQALRAHGGWDAWREVSELELVMERTCAEHSEASGDAGVPRRIGVLLARRGEAGRWRVNVERDDAGGPGATESRGELIDTLEDDAVFLVNAAPFSFVRRDLAGEYVGIEVDAASGTSLRKVRFSPSEPAPPFPCTAYFDTTTRRLRRLVMTTPAGGFLLLIYSSWSRPFGSELTVADQRGLHFLETRLDHPDLQNPDCAEQVVSTRIESDED